MLVAADTEMPSQGHRVAIRPSKRINPQGEIEGVSGFLAASRGPNPEQRTGGSRRGAVQRRYVRYGRNTMK